MKRFTKEHEWIEAKGDTGKVGISDFAQDQLGDIVYIELPDKGKKLKKGDVLCTIESVKAANDIYSPVSGEVIEINGDLDANPELINEDAEGKGWIVEIKLSDTSELDDLMTEEEYRKYAKEEG
ncbi:MAG TPA: glycine cleavage system protein GcvH [Kosmotogaceae bacterium]|nr:MAG: Glycine cleavage system H protein [Thermotogales bacterium 46_20]HAA86295.1 glycine cleavage system protein GcvH [Kosmotogaceae bacterium]